MSPAKARARLRELDAEKLTERDIAGRLGLKHPSLRLHPDAITVRKHLRIALEYRRLTGEGPDAPLGYQSY